VTFAGKLRTECGDVRNVELIGRPGFFRLSAALVETPSMRREWPSAPARNRAIRHACPAAPPCSAQGLCRVLARLLEQPADAHQNATGFWMKSAILVPRAPRIKTLEIPAIPHREINRKIINLCYRSDNLQLIFGV
jgi:hypothetical protein